MSKLCYNRRINERKNKMKENVIYDSDWAVNEHEGDNWNDFYDFHFDDEVGNLYKELDSRILVIADLGLWNGRKKGYKFLNRKNLNDIMYAGIGDHKRVYVKDNDVYMEDTHHDGSNTYIFRLVKNEDNIDILTDKIYNEDYTQKDINRYTTSLAKMVKEIYGWK